MHLNITGIARFSSSESNATVCYVYMYIPCLVRYDVELDQVCNVTINLSWKVCFLLHFTTIFCSRIKFMFHSAVGFISYGILPVLNLLGWSSFRVFHESLHGTHVASNRVKFYPISSWSVTACGFTAPKLWKLGILKLLSPRIGISIARFFQDFLDLFASEGYLQQCS